MAEDPDEPVPPRRRPGRPRKWANEAERKRASRAEQRTRGFVTLIQVPDSLSYLRAQEDESFHLILSDFPYPNAVMKGKYQLERWEYLTEVAAELHRVLKTGHRIYLYAN